MGTKNYKVMLEAINIQIVSYFQHDFVLLEALFIAELIFVGLVFCTSVYSFILSQ